MIRTSAAMVAILVALSPLSAGRTADYSATLLSGANVAHAERSLPEVDRFAADAIQIKAVLDNRTAVILAGIRSGDVAGIMELYAPDALYSPSAGSLLEQREDIAAFWIEVAASPAHDAKLEVLRIERLAPDAFVEIQKYDVFDADGARLFGGYAALLWRNIEGRWLIAADVSN